MTTTDIEERIKLTHRLADVAGDVLRSYFRAGPIDSGTKIKEISSIVTIADTQVEHIMRSLIRQHFPEDGIIGEELGSVPSKGSGVSWVIDPIDGTSSFVRGLPVFGTLIGCINDETGEVLCGVLDQAILGERFVAYSKKEENNTTTISLTLNGEPIYSSYTDGERYSSLAEVCLCSTTPRMFVSYKEQECIKNAWAVCKRTAFGGDCYNYAMLASGRSAMPLVVLEADMKYFDFCALIPIIKGSGGYITDWTGQSLTKDSTQVLAAPNINLWEQMIKVLGKTNE
jgi:inositol-phosphate phosphatase/L-galactose 1-phosphate phosphatase/histidinol-phosphatase